MSRFNDVGTSKVENKIVACIEEFLSSIQGISEISSKLMDSKLSHTVGNMMNEILFGIHYDENDKNWIKIQKLREAGIKEIQVATPVNFLPWLRHLGGKYLVFVSSRSVKMRGSSAFSVCIFLRKMCLFFNF